MARTPRSGGSLSHEDVTAIRQTLEAMVEAELAGDWAAAAELCTEDHVAMPANRPVLHGRAAWLEWVESFDVQFTEMSAEASEIDGRGDLAYLWGTYAESYVAAGSSEPMRGTGKFLWILSKQSDGRWLVAVAIGNSDKPPPRTGSGDET